MKDIVALIICTVLVILGIYLTMAKIYDIGYQNSFQDYLDSTDTLSGKIPAGNYHINHTIKVVGDLSGTGKWDTRLKYTGKPGTSMFDLSDQKSIRVSNFMFSHD